MDLLADEPQCSCRGTDTAISGRNVTGYSFRKMEASRIGTQRHGVSLHIPRRATIGTPVMRREMADLPAYLIRRGTTVS